MNPAKRREIFRRFRDANPNPETELEHHNIPSVQATPTDPEAARGKLAFESKCLACHSIGQGKTVELETRLQDDREAGGKCVEEDGRRDQGEAKLHGERDSSLQSLHPYRR